MRPVYPYDLQDVARALLQEHCEDRPAIARAILDRATIADRYRKRFNRSHPEFGNGTLSAAARSFPLAAMPWRCHQDYLDCTRIFLSAYLDRPSHRDL